MRRAEQAFRDSLEASVRAERERVELRTRYLTDAEFHARVYQEAVELHAAECYEGCRMLPPECPGMIESVGWIDRALERHRA